MKVLVLILVLIVISIVGPSQLKAYGEISTLIPPQNTITVNGTSFTIPYGTTGGTVTSIQADTDTKTLDINVMSPNGGSFTITLPRTLIDSYQGSEQTHLVIMDKNHGVQYKSVDTPDNRTLTIPLSAGSNAIEIKGTFMVPEFGPLVSVILVIAIVSIIAITKIHSKFQVC